jgi:hypothetical protein
MKMKTKIIFGLMVFIVFGNFFKGSVEAEDFQELSFSGVFFCSAYGGEIEKDSYNTAEIRKARLKIDYNSRGQYDLKVHFRGDLETGNFVAKQLYFQSSWGTNTTQSFQGGLVCTPGAELYPAPEQLETFDYPISVRLCTLEEVGFRYDLGYKKIELKTAVTNGNGRSMSDDNEAKRFHLFLGWKPDWGSLKVFYIREFGNIEKGFRLGSGLDTQLSEKLSLRVSGIYFDDTVSESWGWNSLWLYNFSEYSQVIAQYEQFQDQEQERISRVTVGFNQMVLTEVNLGIHFWQNTSGIEEWGIGMFAGISIPKFSI